MTSEESKIISLQPAGPIKLRPGLQDEAFGLPLSAVNECGAKPLPEDMHVRSAWLERFALKQIFHGHLLETGRILACISSVEGSIDDYEEGRVALTEFVGTRRPALYFRSLRRFGNVVISLAVTLENLRAHGKREKGSEEDRIWDLCNALKHEIGDAVEPSSLLVWLTSTGIVTKRTRQNRQVEVSFVELREMLCHMFETVEMILGGVSWPEKGSIVSEPESLPGD